MPGALNNKETKLLRLALCPSAQPGEISAAAEKFFASLRRRNVTAEGLMQFSLSEKKCSKLDPGSVRMPFGRHEGKRVAEVPEDYLLWFCDTVTTHPRLVRIIRKFLTTEDVAA